MDVLVVGAGPAGSVAARRCSELGLDTVLVEEHSEVGRPVRCAGVVSPRALRTCDLPLDGDFAEREIRGAYVHYPDGDRFEMDGGRTRAVVVRRDEMDAALAESAVEAGTDLRLDTRAEVEDEFLLDSEPVEPGVVIDASGAKALAGGEIGLEPGKTLPAVQATIEGARTLSGDFVEVFTGNEWAPGFFAWAVPTERGARVGLATGNGRNPRRLFENFLEEHPAAERLNGEILEWGSGPIPVGPPETTVAGNVLLVGDAAAQAKPTSGGGVYTGAAAAKAAAETAHAHLERGEPLETYDDLWREEFGRELWFGLKVHRALCRATDRDIAELLTLVEDWMPVVREHGDIDHPSALASALLRRPAPALRLAALYLRNLARGKGL